MSNRVHLSFKMLVAVLYIRAVVNGADALIYLNGGVQQKTTQMIYLASMGVILFFVLRIKIKSEQQFDCQTVLANLVAALGPSLLSSNGIGLSHTLGLMFISLGALLSLTAVIDLGKCFDILPTSTATVRRGTYAFIRHPIYTGYCISLLGALLMSMNMRNVALVSCIICALFVRARIEERLLSSVDPEGYASYSKNVNNRFFPELKLWLR